MCPGNFKLRNCCEIVKHTAVQSARQSSCEASIAQLRSNRVISNPRGNFSMGSILRASLLTPHFHILSSSTVQFLPTRRMVLQPRIGNSYKTLSFSGIFAAFTAVSQQFASMPQDSNDEELSTRAPVNRTFVLSNQIVLCEFDYSYIAQVDPIYQQRLLDKRKQTSLV